MAWGARYLISAQPLTELEAVDVDNRGVAPGLGMFVHVGEHRLAKCSDFVRRRPRRQVDRDAQRRLRTPWEEQVGQPETPLGVAVQNGFCVSAGLLLDAGADPHALGRMGLRPVHLAAYKGFPRCLEHLIEHGADVEKIFLTKVKVPQTKVTPKQSEKSASLKTIFLFLTKWQVGRRI